MEKKKKPKPIFRWRKETVKIRTEVNAIEKSIKPRLHLQKPNKINKILARWTKQKRKAQIIKSEMKVGTLILILQK
jgi:hypothetical protein